MNTKLITLPLKLSKVDRQENPAISDFVLDQLKYQYKQIYVSTAQVIDIILVSTIDYIQSSSNYSTIYLQGNKKILTSKTLKYWEDKIDDRHFIRCHNSYLINTQRVKSIDLKDAQVNMGTIKIPLSRTRKSEVLTYFSH